MDEPNILIKTALHDAVQCVNGGMSPTEALQKVAGDLDLNPNYIHRTGEALNVALHYKHFKTAEDRSTEFPIADIGAAITNSFASNEKTAAEYVADNFGSGVQTDVVFNYNRMLSNPMYKRAFIEISNEIDAYETYPTTFDTVYEKSANYVRNLAKLTENAETEKVAAEDNLNGIFSGLAQEFRKDAGYRTSFAEVESQVYSKHGEAAVPYLDLLHKTASAESVRGVHDEGYIMFDQCKEAQIFDELMTAAGNFVTAEKRASSLNDEYSTESSYLKEACHDLGKIAKIAKDNSTDIAVVDKDEDGGSSEDEESDDPVLQEIKKKAANADYSVETQYNADPVLQEALQKESLDKEAFLGQSVLESFGDNVMSRFSTGFGAAAAPAKRNLTMDNMERKLLLQELLLTDPILSKVNPTKVAQAYEQLLRLSPEISKEKEVVRAELRAMVASQALSKYDAEMMTKLDMGMVKRRISTDSFNSGLTSNFRL